MIETHLIEDKSINIDGYTWYGFNRSLKHVKAKRGSGGIGFLIKDYIYDEFKIRITDKTYDGIMALELTHKATDFNVTVIGAYLPPENSVYGRESSNFFSQLIALVYSSINSDVTILCGDLNARVGNRLDYICDVDILPDRTAIDHKVNNHGETFLEFLKDVKMCIINGRINPIDDNFTSVSTRGKSVVDYIVVPHECVKFCTNFNVKTVHEEIDRLKLHGQITSKCKPPDHSILTVCVMCTYDLSAGFQRVEENVSSGENVSNLMTNRMYCFNNRPNEFMKSVTWTNAILKIINMQEEYIQSQECVDRKYNEFCSILFSEMDKYLDIKGGSKRVRKKYKHHKPYWNSELTTKWKEMRNKEKAYLRSHTGVLLQEFKLARNKFDKSLRYFERQYNKEKVLNIEKCNTNDPKEFWKHIKSLGPRKKQQYR